MKGHYGSLTHTWDCLFVSRIRKPKSLPVSKRCFAHICFLGCSRIVETSCSLDKLLIYGKTCKQIQNIEIVNREHIKLLSSSHNSFKAFLSLHIHHPSLVPCFCWNTVSIYFSTFTWQVYLASLSVHAIGVPIKERFILAPGNIQRFGKPAVQNLLCFHGRTKCWTLRICVLQLFDFVVAHHFASRSDLVYQNI